jgi:threonylcarbamoyladenosine tRNA methylthiotransferase MtaB
MGRLRVAWRTLGCRVNQYDTELMKEQLIGTFEIVPNCGEADVYIINTCTVTARAEAKARQYIHGLARRGLVLVTGCWATVAPEEIARIEGVSLVFPNNAKLQVRKLVQRALAGGQGIASAALDGASLEEERIGHDLAHTRAFVKIQDGCDRFCTFCRTVFARGRSRSKSPQAVLAEVSQLVENGFVEIVLTGINLAAYGEDNGASLVELLWALVELEGLKRIRLSSLNPEGITPALVEFFGRSGKACPYFHLPLQSGDDLILKRMDRGYTVAEYREKTDLIRERLPQATWGADILVGFPGEAEEQFSRTCRLIEELVPLRLHIFRYSRRPGTAAARFPGQVPERVKLERARRLRELGEELSRRVRQRYIDRRLEVLVEERGAEGLWHGWSENYIEVGILPCKGRELRSGEIVPVRIQQLAEDYLLGEVD